MPINLKKITTGKKPQPQRVLIYAADGVGKTRFAAGAPEPFFLDANRGSYEYDVRRVVPETWEEAHEWVEAVGRGEVKCKTLVLDAMGDFESMSHAKLFPNSSVGEHGGGWGKGDDLVLIHWREFLSKLEAVWSRGIGIVMVAHAIVRKFEDPRMAAYDRFEVAVRPRLAGLLRSWSDAVLFAAEKTTTQKIGEKARGVTTGVRYLYTSRTAAYDAKSRGVVNMPEEVLLSWSSYQQARDEAFQRAVEMRVEIDAMLAELGDPAVKAKCEAFLKDNPDDLAVIKGRLTALLEVRKTAEPPAVEPQQQAAAVS